MKSRIGIIISREFNERVRRKSFVFTTLLTPLLMIGLMFAPMLISGYSGNDMVAADDVTIDYSSSLITTILAYVLSLTLYMFILLYGVMVMHSVTEEKNNRVLEVLVSTVRPFEMMMGKILGIACVALLQIAIWIVLITGIAYFILPNVLPDDILFAMELLKQGVPASAFNGGTGMGLLQAIIILSDIEYVGGIALWMLVFTFGGFLLYAAMFAAVGSAVDSPQDAQQLQTPIVLPIILSLLVMVSVINDPSSDAAFWFSIIPLTSPIVMMARIPFEVPMWEIGLSALLLYATFLAVVWGAGKIYRVGILMHGKKPSLKELLRWIMYK